MPTKSAKVFECDLSVVGLQFRRGFDKEKRENLAKKLRTMRNGQPIALAREQENPYDENAIAVKYTKAFGGDKIGYITRESAAVLAPMMDRGELVFLKGVLKEVTGKTFNEGSVHITFVDKR